MRFADSTWACIAGFGLLAIAVLVLTIYPGGFHGTIGWLYVLLPGIPAGLILAGHAYKIAPNADRVVLWGSILIINFAWYFAVSYAVIKTCRRLARRLGLIAAAVTIVCAAWYLIEKRSQHGREVLYAAALHSYSEMFRVGMNRKEVEDRLRAKNISFSQTCCVENNAKWVLDDITRIGQEGPPWYCSEYNIYVAFQFVGPKPTSGGPGSENTDTLSKVALYGRGEASDRRALESINVTSQAQHL